MDRRRFIQTGSCLGFAATQHVFALLENAQPMAPILEGLNQGVSASSLEIAGNPMKARIGIIAVGGAGGAILSKLDGKLLHLHRSIAIDTDRDALSDVVADRKILFDSPLSPIAFLTSAAIEQIAKAVTDLDFVFIVAGMGGSMGTVIAPIIAQALKETDITTVSAAITPFAFEGQQRYLIVESGLYELCRTTNILIPIKTELLAQSARHEGLFLPHMMQSMMDFRPSEQNVSAWLLREPVCSDFKTTVVDGLMISLATQYFEQLYRGITAPFCESGFVEIDLEEIKELIADGRQSALGFGSCNGPNSAETSTHRAIEHPMLGEHPLRTASRILVSIERPADALDRCRDIHTILSTIRKSIGEVGHEQTIVFSSTRNKMLSDEFRVTILASGIHSV